MNKVVKVVVTLVTFSAIALIVYIAGETALSTSPLLALIPVCVLLALIVLYIRSQDKE